MGARDVNVPSYYKGLELARPTLTYAEEYTRRLTSSHYENFPVASLFIPKNLRQHVCNIYAFARIADDFADETGYEGRRLENLDEWEEELKLAYRGASIHPVFVALEKTLREIFLPEQLFLDLIKAFKMDVVKKRYKNFDEVMYYCKHSANPVGRLILLLFGYNNEEWFRWSDNVCTALQLANFWQDVSVDLTKGRIYIPQDELVGASVTEYDLEAFSLTDGLKKVMVHQVERTRDIFIKGRPLCRVVPNIRLSYELRLTWLGGMKVLEKIKNNNYDIFVRPTLKKLDWGRLFLQALLF